MWLVIFIIISVFASYILDSQLKVWLKQNKFYITIAQVTEHKKKKNGFCLKKIGQGY